MATLSITIVICRKAKKIIYVVLVKKEFSSLVFLFN